MKKMAVLAMVLFSTLAYAQEAAVVAYKVESDYTETKVFVEDLSCSMEKSSLLEKSPEIVTVLFISNGRSCGITLIHKKTFKLVGKAFHVLTSGNGYFASVNKFFIEKK